MGSKMPQKSTFWPQKCLKRALFENHVKMPQKSTFGVKNASKEHFLTLQNIKMSQKSTF